MLYPLVWTTLATLLGYVDAKAVCDSHNEIGIGWTQPANNARPTLSLLSYECKTLAVSDYEGSEFPCPDGHIEWPEGYNLECDSNGPKKITTPDASYVNCEAHIYKTVARVGLPPWKKVSASCGLINYGSTSLTYCCQKVGQESLVPAADEGGDTGSDTYANVDITNTGSGIDAGDGYVDYD